MTTTDLADNPDRGENHEHAASALVFAIAAVTSGGNPKTLAELSITKALEICDSLNAESKLLGKPTREKCDDDLIQSIFCSHMVMEKIANAFLKLLADAVEYDKAASGARKDALRGQFHPEFAKLLDANDGFSASVKVVTEPDSIVQILRDAGAGGDK